MSEETTKSSALDNQRDASASRLMVERSALMLEAYAQMPESYKEQLHRWEARNLPLGKATSEWPTWDRVIANMGAWRVATAKKRARDAFLEGGLYT